MEGCTAVSLEKFAELEGVSLETVKGWRNRGYVAVVRTGKRVQVDVELTMMRRRYESGTLAEYNNLKQFGLEG